jgi:hypothetical protein
MAAASGGSGFNLVQDGFVDGIYHFLWQKISQQSCPNVSIPDTVVYKYRQPAYWYFMSVDGSIKMKTQKNITNAKIFEAFSKQRPDAVSDIVAYYISPVESDRGVTGKTTIEFFDVAGLHKFLFHRAKTDTGIVQRYVESKGEHNCVIRAVWTPNLCLMERRLNNNRVTDRKIGMYERAVTYEGATHYSDSLPINGTVLPAAIQTVCASMVDHFCEADLRISRMVLHMKMDANDKLWVTWCSSMRLQDVPERVNPVNLGPSFRERGFTKMDASMRCPEDGKKHPPEQMVKVPYSTIVKVHTLRQGEHEKTTVPPVLLELHPGMTDSQYDQLRRDPVFLFREAMVSESAFLKYTQEAERLEESKGDFSMSMDALDQFVQDIPQRPSSSLRLLAGQELSEGQVGGGAVEGGASAIGLSESRSQLDSSLGIVRIEQDELPVDVFDRLHINASSSFILKNTEKVELDDSKPFYVGVSAPNGMREM